MVKKILPLLWLLTACTETPVTLEPHVDIDIYAELPYQNGYYYLDVVNGEKQTFGRLGGTIQIDGELPEQPVKATWESNLYWTLVYNETTGEYERVITHYPNKVPTINSSSYSNRGMVNTMIAPIYEMEGDTMVVILTAEYTSDTIRIILQ